MIKLFTKLLAIVVIIFFLSAFITLEDNFSGVVTEIGENSFTVESEDEDGNIETKDFVVNDATKFFIGDEEASFEDLEDDDSVSVSFKTEEENLIALKVSIDR